MAVPVTFAASTVPFLTTWKVACAPPLIVLPALLRLSPRLLKKLPISAEDSVALRMTRDKHIYAFACAILGVCLPAERITLTKYQT